VASPNVLGLIGQTQAAMNLTGGTGTMVWQIAKGLNPANADLSWVQNSTLNVVDKTMSFLRAEAKSPRRRARRLFAF
jgi:hypothetical protein